MHLQNGTLGTRHLPSSPLPSSLLPFITVVDSCERRGRLCALGGERCAQRGQDCSAGCTTRNRKVNNVHISLTDVTRRVDNTAQTMGNNPSESHLLSELSTYEQ